MRIVVSLVLAAAVAAPALAAEPLYGPLVQVAAGSRPEPWRLLAQRYDHGDGLCVELQGGAATCGERPTRNDPLGGPAVDDEGCGTRVFGAVHARVRGIRVRLADGRVLRARLYASPPALKFGGRLFLARTARRAEVLRVRALDAGGRTLTLLRVGPDDVGGGCTQPP